MDEQTLTFAKVKETKNKIRYEEVGGPGYVPVIGTLYLDKTSDHATDKVEVTIKGVK